jgi:hypothetical protein
MWEPRRLTTVWAFTACGRDSFTFTFTIKCNLARVLLMDSCIDDQNIESYSSHSFSWNYKYITGLHRRYPSTRLHGVITQKTALCIFTTMKASDFWHVIGYCYHYHHHFGRMAFYISTDFVYFEFIGYSLHISHHRHICDCWLINNMCIMHLIRNFVFPAPVIL